jgi:hypothetical protein
MTSMKTKLRRKQGRKSSGLPFVQLFKYMLRCPAWRGLSVTAKAAYVHLSLRYDGCNNGMLALSARVLGHELQCHKTTAARALVELEDAGFIESVRLGSFARRNRRATEYRLTTYGCDITGDLPTKKFMRSATPDPSGEIRSLKPWQAEGISERTWYRRRQAAGHGRMAVPRSHHVTVTVAPGDCQIPNGSITVAPMQPSPCHGTPDGRTHATHIESHHGGSGGDLKCFCPMLTVVR